MKARIALASISLCAMFGVAFCAVSIQDAPEVTSRNAPSSSNSSIYSYHNSIKDAVNAVVSISTQKRVKTAPQSIFGDPFFQQFFGDFYRVPQSRIERALGSGTIVTSDGYIVTNNHVIDGADKITVNLPNSRREYSAKVIGTDPDSDLAVIKIDDKNLPFLKFANTKTSVIGDVVFAIGNPFGVGETVTQGIISAINKTSIGINNYEDFIQTDTSINPGNSGGALIDTRGALVGINTAILSRSGGNIGIGFAIPANIVKRVATELINTGKIERGYLGVTTQNVSEELRGTYGGRDGAVVLSIDKNSPAQKAGLLVWDLITKVNNSPVRTSADLRNLIGAQKPNSKVTITLVRDGKEREVSVILDKRKSAQSPALTQDKKEAKGDLSGLRVEDITKPIRDQYQIPNYINGVLVAAVSDNSPAQKAGFSAGDIIARIENNTISNIKDFNQAIRMYKDKTKRVLVFTREGLRTIVLK